MKKRLILLFAVVLALSLCSCSIIKNKIVHTIKNVVAEISVAPDDTETPADETVASDVTDEPQDTSDVTEAPGDTAQPQDETAAPDDTVAPQDGDNAGGWPDGLPNYVPVFSAGTCQKDQTVKYEADDSTTYSLSFTGVQKKDIDDYAAALKKKGMQIYKTESSGQYSVTATLQKSNKIVAMISVSLDTSDNSCSFTMMLYTAK